MDKKLVFIASGGRTGTQFLGDLLATVIDDCWSEHEADMFAGFSKLSQQRIRDFGLWHMVFGRALGQTGLRAAGTRYLTGKCSIEESARQLRSQRFKYYARIDQDLIVESYARWWMFAGEIGKIWPGAKTVGIFRDPRAWISSWLSHHRSHADGPWTEKFPPGPINPKTIGDHEWTSRWSGLSSVGRLAWEWREVYGRIDLAVSGDPNMNVFRFEDLFNPEQNTMQSLVEFVCDHGDVCFDSHPLEGFMDSSRNASNASADDWLNWTPEDRKLVDEICGPLMKKFNYPPMQFDAATQENVIA